MAKPCPPSSPHSTHTQEPRSKRLCSHPTKLHGDRPRQRFYGGRHDGLLELLEHPIGYEHSGLDPSRSSRRQQRRGLGRQRDLTGLDLVGMGCRSVAVLIALLRTAHLQFSKAGVRGHWTFQLGEAQVHALAACLSQAHKAGRTGRLPSALAAERQRVADPKFSLRVCTGMHTLPSCPISGIRPRPGRIGPNTASVSPTRSVYSKIRVLSPSTTHIPMKAAMSPSGSTFLVGYWLFLGPGAMRRFG